MARPTREEAGPETMETSEQSEAERPSSRTFPCESCGAELEFSIGEQDLACRYCGFVKTLDLGDSSEIEEQDLEAALETLSRRRQAGAPPPPTDLGEVRCEGCGALVTFRGTLTSRSCPYCGTPLQRSDLHQSAERIRVDGVLPFQVERRKARANLAAWMRSRWFAPNAFIRGKIVEKIEGVYLPFWTFDAMTFTRYRGARGEHYYVTVGSGKNRRRVRRTRWYPASGSFQRFFDDVPVLAAEDLPEKVMRALEPWPLKRCVPFTDEVLSGYLARTYDKPLDRGFSEARVRIDQSLEADVRARIGGDVQRVDAIDTRYDGLTYKHLLLPAWLLAHRFRERLYRIVVNAGTGEVSGERPYSWVKIALAASAAAALLATAVSLYTRFG